MVDPKVTYDYGTGVLTLDRGQGRGLRVSLTGEEFDSVVKQLADVCTAELADYDRGFKAGYAKAESEAPDRYDDGYDDGYDEGYSVGYTEAEAQWEDDEDDE